MFRRRETKQPCPVSSASSVDGGRPQVRRRRSINSVASFSGANSVASFGGGSFSGGSVGGGASGRIPMHIGVTPTSISVGGGSVGGSVGGGSLHRRVPRQITSGSASVRAGRRTSLDTFQSLAESAASKDDGTVPRYYSSSKQKGIMRYSTLAESLQTVFGSHHSNCEGTVSTNLSHSSRNLHSTLHSQPSERSMDTHTTGSSARYSRYSLCSAQRRRRVHHHVGFSSVEVREYLRIVGDNPACSAGPPISIGWDYYPDVKMHDIDDYEELQRHKRRSEMDLVLSRHLREEMLTVEWGFCSTDLVAAVQAVIRVKTQRRISVHRNGSVLERTGSKLLRKLLLKRNSTKDALELQRRHLAFMAQQAKQAQLLQEQNQRLEEESQHVVRPKDEEFDYASYYLPSEERTQYVYSPLKPPKKAVSVVPSSKIKILVPAMKEDQRDLHFMPDRYAVA